MIATFKGVGLCAGEFSATPKRTAKASTDEKNSHLIFIFVFIFISPSSSPFLISVHPAKMAFPMMNIDDIPLTHTCKTSFQRGSGL
jgi:hypothetical protein